MLYYSLYNGLGETKTCSTQSGTLCLPWQNKNIWASFSSITKNTRTLGYDMQADWVVIQVLLPITICLCSIALYLHSVVELTNYPIKSSSHPQRSAMNTFSYPPLNGNNISQTLLKTLQWKVNYTTIGANLIFISWICTLICIDFNRNSMTMSSALWTNLYKGDLQTLFSVLIYSFIIILIVIYLHALCYYNYLSQQCHI